ncbi:MAG: ATP-binding cassette domain-containing protein [Clostridiaceae bacterium]|jgi:ABC-type nitrate/sulfonate/bicarbonate transport system ATPase subunit/ABC-type nitrate/sulfonate/bicarbonate transport system permease component|nr:ATP-binding cassette domain-containing protein [Clostridiaceae bacterium]
MKIKNDKLKRLLHGAVNNILFPLAAFGVITAVWAIASVAVDKPIIFPQADAIFREFFKLLADGAFYKAVSGTLGRALLSYVLSFAVALLFAAAGTAFKPVHKILNPLVTVLRAAPTMAIILLAVLWLDYSQSPVLIGFLISFPLLYSAIYSALSATDKDLLSMASAFKMRKIDIFTGIYMPSVTPAVFDAVKSTVSLNVKVVIAAEVIALTRGGMGLEMYKNNLLFDIPRLLAWTVAAIALSFLLEIAVTSLKKILLSRKLQARLFNLQTRLAERKNENLDAQKTKENTLQKRLAERKNAENLRTKKPEENTPEAAVYNAAAPDKSAPEAAVTTETCPGITLKIISKAYGDLKIFDGFSYEFGRGITCVLGASGSGKTTLLNIISGMTDYVGENDVSGGDFSYIFQNDRLIENITVYKNLDLVLRSKIKDKLERRARIADALKLVELSGAAGKLPRELSGGQGQRVAMARAFIYPAPVLLMDEPFKALDVALKERLAAVFLRLFNSAERTVVFVTHDIFEAVKLADKAIVIGGTPARIVFETAIAVPKTERNAFAAGMEDLKSSLYTALTLGGED